MRTREAMIRAMERIGLGGRKPRAKSRGKWIPESVAALEERVVPAFTPPSAAGYVTTILTNTDHNSGFVVSPTSQVCTTMALTPAGVAKLQANALDNDPTNDAIAVGLASYILTDGDSLQLQKQEALDFTSGELSLDHRSVELCVDVDDALCTQVDNYTGSNPLNFTTGEGVYDLPGQPKRFIRGAIFFEGQYVTNNLGSGETEHVCPDMHRGQQGLTIGYWKNHTSAWQVYTPDRTLGSIFAGLSEDLDPTTPGVQNHYSSLAGDTLIQALNYSGGPTLVDSARLLLKQATGALLNAANTNIDYPLTTGQVKLQVNTALESMDRDTILALASQLDAYNNLEGVDLKSVNTKKKN